MHSRLQQYAKQAEADAAATAAAAEFVCNRDAASTAVGASLQCLSGVDVGCILGETLDPLMPVGTVAYSQFPMHEVEVLPGNLAVLFAIPGGRLQFICACWHRCPLALSHAQSRGPANYLCHVL